MAKETNYDEDALKELNALTGDEQETSPKKDLGKVDMSKFSHSKGVQDDPEIQRLNALTLGGYQDLPFSTLPSKGRFYPQDMRISIRAARVGEIREFSAINEDSIVDVTDKLNYIISQCTRVMYGNVPGSYKDILDIDRLVIILNIRAITFTDGLSNIKIPIPPRSCKTPGCRPQENVPLSLDLFKFKRPETIEKYFNPATRSYQIQTKDYGVIEMFPATIGVANTVMQWIVEQEKQQKKWDGPLVTLIPYLVKDWRGLSDEKIFQIASSFEGWDTTKFTLIYRIAEELASGVEAELTTTCETCGGEIKFPFSFPNGWKSLFVPTVHDILGQLV